MTRVLTLGFLVLATGCVANHAELERQQAALDGELAMLQARADGLNERRREADQLELELQPGFAEFPEIEAAWKAAEAGAPAIATPRPPLLLPPESLFEGSDGARMRALLTDTDARIRMLDRVVNEVVLIELHNQRALRAQASIEQARAARAK